MNLRIADARRLLEEVDNIMSGIEPGSSWYDAVDSAAAWLEYLIAQSNPDEEAIIAAMSALTQAIAGNY